MPLSIGRVAACVVILSAGSLLAQAPAAGEPDHLNLKRNRRGEVTFITPKGQGEIPVANAVAAAPRAIDFFHQYGRFIGIRDPEQQLRALGERRDGLGRTQARFQQVHKNIRVFGGIYKTHQDENGRFTAANGRFFEIPEKLDTVPTLQVAAARRIAKEAVGDAEAHIQETELVIVDPAWYGDASRGARLAYRVHVDKDHEWAEAFFIDAHSGEVLDRWSLSESIRNRRIHNGNGGSALPGTLARTEGGSATGNVAVDQAYDYAGDVYDYYARAFQRDGIDDGGMPIIFTVNSTAPTCPNAFWNGAQAVFCNGMQSDDIVAHELTHGVVGYTAELIYQNQPGQLNESFADIFGELVDLFNGNAAFGEGVAGPPWPVTGSGPGTDSPNALRGNSCIGGNSLEVLQPAGIAGEYVAGSAAFGPVPTQTGTGGNLAVTNPVLGCTAISGSLAGKIALIDRGTCNFTVKAKNAQNAGAIGVVIVNNQPGGANGMSGSDPTVIIPTISISQDDGNVIKAALASDAVSVRVHSNPDDEVRWLVGEDSGPGALRDMWNPPCGGSPDRANSPLQTCEPEDNGGVHSGSGVPNHAFALVTDGGQFNGFLIGGIGPIKSGAVWYRALTTYLTITSDFEDAYAALTQAAEDLVGTFPADPRTGSPTTSMFTEEDALQVDLALLAVEMNGEGQCGASQAVLSPDPPVTCGGQRVVYNDEFEQGTNGWTVSNSNPPTPYNWFQTSDVPVGSNGTAWFVQDADIGNCQSVIEAGTHSLTSPSIVLPNDAVDPFVQFMHFMGSEPGYDGGNVKIKVNGGAFTTVPLSAFDHNGYNATLIVNSNNPLAGQPGFTGIGSNWGTSIINLEGLASPGDTIRFRFDFGKDGCGGFVGWYMADFAVLSCAPSGNGDFDDSGRVDLKDVAAFQRCTGEQATGGSECAQGDLNADGTVDVLDVPGLVEALTGP